MLHWGVYLLKILDHWAVEIASGLTDTLSGMVKSRELAQNGGCNPTPLAPEDISLPFYLI